MSNIFDSSSPGITLNVDVPFPSNATSGPGVAINKTNAIWAVSLDFPDLVDGGSPSTPSNVYLAGYDTGLKQYEKLRLDNIIAGATGLDARTPRGDANYSITITDRYIGLTAALTAVRTFTLPDASTVPGGRIVTVQDEVGGVSGANYISFSPTGVQTINGVNGAYLFKTTWGAISFRSNGSNAWNVVVPSQRRAVADAAYTATQGDSIVAYTALSAARIVTLPAASAYPLGQRLTVADESGSCSGTNTITLARAASDTINGATSQVISLAYGYCAVESDGVSKWTIVDSSGVALPGLFSTLSTTGAATFGATTITSSSATSLVVGPNGATNPVLRVDGSFASAATGLYLEGLSAGAGMLVQTLSSGTNENLVIDAKGTGSVFLGLNSTGGVNLASGGGAVVVNNALSIGKNGSIPSQGLLSGLGLSNDGTSPNTVIDIAAGTAQSDDNTATMILGSAYTKTTGAWAVGSGSGGLDTGAVAASTWYHAYLIKRVDTGVVDVLLSTSPSSPTMPTNYTKKRRIGSFLTNGSSNIIAFTQNGDEFLWLAPVSEIAAATPPDTSAHSLTVTIPTGTGVRVNGLFHIEGSLSTASVTRMRLSSLDINDVAPSVTDSTMTFGQVSGTATSTLANVRALAGQIRYRFSATTNVTWWLTTLGWIDTRGK